MNPSRDARKPLPAAVHPTPDRPGTYRHERHLQAQLRLDAAMAPDQTVTADHVRDVILKDLDRRKGGNGVWHVEPVLRARESWLFKASTASAPWPLAVKVYCAAVPDRLAERQFRALRRYHAAMAGQAMLTVPAPWAVLPEHRTLLMEWVDGPRMDKLLRRAPPGPQRQRIIAAAARWLRHFHSQGAQSVQPLKSIDLVQRVDLFLGEEGAGAAVRDPAFRSAYRVLQNSVATFAAAEMPFVVSHGDFTPVNLFHGPDRTVGFDFKANSARPPALDIMHFLVYANSFCTSASLLRAAQFDRQDRHAFLSSYGPIEEIAGDERLLAVFRLAEALATWAHLIERMSRQGLNMRRLARALRLRGIAKDAARSLDRGNSGLTTERA